MFIIHFRLAHCRGVVAVEEFVPPGLILVGVIQLLFSNDVKVDSSQLVGVGISLLISILAVGVTADLDV